MKKLGALMLVVCLCVPVVGLAAGCGCPAGAACGGMCSICTCKKTTTTVTEGSDTTSPDYKYTEYTLLVDTVVYNSIRSTDSNITLPAGTTVLLGTQIMGRVNILYDNEQRAGYIVLEGDDAEWERWMNDALAFFTETVYQTDPHIMLFEIEKP